MQHLLDFNQQAHRQFLHPNLMPWSEVRAPRELDFVARALAGHQDEHGKAVAYLYKELSQLAEIEWHVATVMMRVVCEAAADPERNRWAGADLVHTLCCFASEEIQHANTFYRYVRELSGRDLKIERNQYAARTALYAGDENPRVKLAALCATAYIGETVITVFEQRMKALDPDLRSPFTQLLHLHGLDEARHLQADHFVIDHVVSGLDARETAQMNALIEKTEAFNRELSMECAARVKEAFGFDYAVGNHAAAMQLEITNGLRRAILCDGTVNRVETNLDAATRQLIEEFSLSEPALETA